MTNKYDSENSRDRAEPDFDRYETLSDDGAVVVYDTENHDAWLKSDDAVEIEEMA